MDMNNFRPELHIAQQSRRDKLRIQNDSNHHLGVFANNLDQIPGNICYDPSEFCSEMLHFPVEEPDKRAVIGAGSYPNCAVSSDPQYFSGWRSVGSQSSSDWIMPSNHGPIFVGDGLSGSSMKIMSSSNPVSSLDAKPYLGFQELHSSSEISNTKQFVDMNCNSSLYHSALQELVRQKSSEGNSNHGPWAGSELLLLPAYADQLGLKGPADLMSRPAQECNQWSGEMVNGRDLRTVANDNSNTQALSLSLSSVPSPKVHECQIGEKDFRIRDNCHEANVQDSRIWKPECLTPNVNLSRGVGAQALTHRNPGPLGPFTGYATILRSSKFLRPAQQLLDEICCIARPKNVEICEVSDRIFNEVRVSNEGVSNGDQCGLKAIAGESSLSSFPFNGSYDKSREPGGTSCSTDSHCPENLHKKAKLLYMQDEVCKRYKQYHQQMQMVVSSFESVAGLSAATPYVSLALKMIAKHFRCLKNAITDQLKSIKNALGEELSSPSGGTSSTKGGEAASVSMLKFFDQNFQKQKGAGILEGQHIWRPQRGLPERAVSVLRAWLFDHFLHPYPTDTDKHMLAAQTGLTRNQVSNWFINARVRVWKPMVEEIHMLETKGATESGSEASKTTRQTPVENRDQPNESNRLRMSAQVECSSISPPERQNPSMWNQEKRSRLEYHSVDGSLMGFVPSHHRSGGEMGSVSLTLGLRQSAENAQRQPEHHFRPHYGGQIIRDFVG